MTTTTFDLRRAFDTIFSRAGSPAGEGENGDAAGSTDPPLPADASTEGDQDTGEQDAEDDVKNPRIKQLSDEAAKHRNNAKAEKERADAAETKATDLASALREARMFNAFVVAGIGKIADVEAAWKLADKVGVTVGDDGTITGMDEVIAKTLERYPYLSPQPASDAPEELVDKFPALQPSGRQTNGKAKLGDSLNRKALEGKFPALRSR